MPVTLPGFLIAAGLTLFVGSLFRGPVDVLGVKLPALSDQARMTLRVLGIVLIVVSAVLFYFGITPCYLMDLDDHPMAPP